jgi:hypothetical protein
MTNAELKWLTVILESLEAGTLSWDHLAPPSIS